MSVVRHLPATAWMDGVVAGALQGAFGAWSRNWLRGTVTASADVWLPGRSPSSIGQEDDPVLCLQEQSGLLSIVIGQKTLDGLAEAIFGVALQPEQINEFDKEFLQSLLRDALTGLAQQMCVDLPGLSKLELVKAGDVSLDKLGRHGFSLSWRTSGSMAMVGRLWGTLDADLAARMRLAFIDPVEDPSDRIPALVPGSLLASIVDRPLALGALLGRAHISATDLERLQPGDVLVLDRPTTSALELTLNDRPVTDWACEPVVERGQPLKLQLKNPRPGASL